jgi:hypothetical protein
MTKDHENIPANGDMGEGIQKNASLSEMGGFPYRRTGND